MRTALRTAVRTVVPGTPATWFRLVAVVEALTWAGLLVGMFFKHVTRTTEVGVQVFGALHGGAFLAYVLVVLLVARPLRWSLWTTGLALVAAVPPFASLVLERWAERSGRLGELSGAGRADTADGAAGARGVPQEQPSA
ncbi:DUF3817 domain-containing protein [Thalassiella azotivora]